MTIEDLSARLEKVEKQTRLWRAVGTIAFVASIGCAWLGVTQGMLLHTSNERITSVLPAMEGSIAKQRQAQAACSAELTTLSAEVTTLAEARTAHLRAIARLDLQAEDIQSRIDAMEPAISEVRAGMLEVHQAESDAMEAQAAADEAQSSADQATADVDEIRSEASALEARVDRAERALRILIDGIRSIR